MDMEHVVDFVQMQRFNDPLLVEVVEAMRTHGGKGISEEAWQAIASTEIKSSVSQPGEIDVRLRDARHWYECAYERRIVSYAMHSHAKLNAKAEGKLLYYIPSIDMPSVRMSKKDFDDMRSQPNISNTAAKFPGILPIYIGMEMYLTETYLPPRIGRGTPVDIVDIEPHPMEPPIQGRDSIASHGCVILRYMPQHIYVRAKNCDSFFISKAS